MATGSGFSLWLALNTPPRRRSGQDGLATAGEQPGWLLYYHYVQDRGRRGHGTTMPHLVCGKTEREEWASKKECFFFLQRFP